MTRELSSIYVVGTDEAGYGPNLGPLVVGASSWRLDALDAPFADANWRKSFLQDATQERADAAEPTPPVKKRGKKKQAIASGPTLFDLTDDAPKPVDAEFDAAFVQRALDRLNDSLAPICSRKGVFPLVDSKKLYASKSLATLERSFWLAQAIRKRRPIRDASSFARATREFDLDLDDYAPPWERDVDFPTPVDPKSGDVAELANLAQAVEAQFDAARVALLDVLVRRVHPTPFNRLLDRLGLKSDLIADVTTSLAVEALARVLSFEPNASTALFVLLCDKLGGRDRYGAVLTARFPDARRQTVVESREVGIYRLEAERARGRDGRLVEFGAPLALEIRFTAKGESNVPTALASICAKYFRELSMVPFNDYWRRATSNESLRPTAGYPVDALRFRADVEDARRRLAIDDDEFWRKK